MSRIERNYLHDNGPASSTGGGFKAKGVYSDDGSTNWNISENVIENNAGPNFRVDVGLPRRHHQQYSWSDSTRLRQRRARALRLHQCVASRGPREGTQGTHALVPIPPNHRTEDKHSQRTKKPEK